MKLPVPSMGLTFHAYGHKRMPQTGSTDSDLYLKGSNRQLFPDQTRTIPKGHSVPIVIVGDPAYPLLLWVMKPYPEYAGMPQKQRKFYFRAQQSKNYSGTCIRLTAGQMVLLAEAHGSPHRQRAPCCCCMCCAALHMRDTG